MPRPINVDNESHFKDDNGAALRRGCRAETPLFMFSTLISVSTVVLLTVSVFSSKHGSVSPAEVDCCSSRIRKEALWNLGKIRVITHLFVRVLSSFEPVRA